MATKRKQPYEGSKQDLTEDKRGAKKLGVSLKRYERTPKDRAEDRRGQIKFNRGLRRGG
jgi:hypothetical protein